MTKVLKVTFREEDSMRALIKKCLQDMEKTPWKSLPILINYYAQIHKHRVSLFDFIEALSRLSNSLIFLHLVRSHLYLCDIRQMERELLESYPAESPIINLLFSWLEKVAHHIMSSVELNSNTFHYLGELIQTERSKNSNAEERA